MVALLKGERLTNWSPKFRHTSRRAEQTLIWLVCKIDVLEAFETIRDYTEATLLLLFMVYWITAKKRGQAESNCIRNSVFRKGFRRRISM